MTHDYSNLSGLTFGHLTHEEMADKVRMLMRGDLDHEGVVTGARDRIMHLAAEVARLENLVYVPGLWRCAKCSFHLTQATLNARTGTVPARDKPGEKCPNCGVPLWRVTEREAGNQMVERCEAAINEAAQLRAEHERRVTELLEANNREVERRRAAEARAERMASIARAWIAARECSSACFMLTADAEAFRDLEAALTTTEPT